MNGAGKKVWGYYPAGDVWLPLQVDENGKVIVDMSAVNLDDLGDVFAAGAIEGDMLYFDETSGTWMLVRQANLANILAALTNLNDLADVAVIAPGDGEALIWDAATSRWIPGAVAGSKIADADGDTKVDVEESADEDMVRMDVKGVEAFVLHDDGILNLPKQSGARAYLSAAQSIPSGVWTVVNLDTESFDIQGEFDTTNHKFVVTQPGLYVAAGSIHFGTTEVVADHAFGVFITKGVFPFSSTLVHSSIASAIEVSVIDAQFLAAADEILLRVFQDTGANKNVSSGEFHTHLTVVKVA